MQRKKQRAWLHLARIARNLANFQFFRGGRNAGFRPLQ